MKTLASPRIRTLTREECDAVLARNHVGRLAYSRRDRVGILPVHYVYADGWLHGRTSPGSKMDALGGGWWPVAFEVDEVEQLFRWRSVVVRGGFYPLAQGRTKWETEAWERSVELLRALVPATLRDGDPVPERTIVFRVAAQEITGREADPGVASAPWSA
jgi:uncharacterized protein